MLYTTRRSSVSENCDVVLVSKGATLRIELRDEEKTRDESGTFNAYEEKERLKNQELDPD